MRFFYIFLFCIFASFFISDWNGEFTVIMQIYVSLVRLYLFLSINLFCMIALIVLFYIFYVQKPKKKKEETNGAADAKNGKEAKPKKTKTKKSEDTSKEESDAVQSEAV